MNIFKDTAKKYDKKAKHQDEFLEVPYCIYARFCKIILTFNDLFCFLNRT